MPEKEETISIFSKIAHAPARLKDKASLALAYIRQARQRSGRSVVSQLAEISRLRWSRTKLGMREYYEYRLYDHRPFSEKRKFVGWRIAFDWQRRFMSHEWGALCGNKLLFYTFCMAHGLPHPRMAAVYLPGAASAAGVTTLHSMDDIRRFLEDSRTGFPLFCKPVKSKMGVGCAGIASFDRGSGTVRFCNGESALFSSFFRENIAPYHEGFIWQEMLHPHPDIAARAGNRLCTVRVYVYMPSGEEPRMAGAILKISTGKNMVDNFFRGTRGNTAGTLDKETGRVMRQLAKAGFNEVEAARHPDTGASIVDFILPDWNVVTELAKQAARCFYGFRMQAWDIALTDKGPMLVELNMPHDLEAQQSFLGMGAWDEVADAMLEE